MSESIQYVSIASLPNWSDVTGTEAKYLAGSRMELELAGPANGSNDNGSTVINEETSLSFSSHSIKLDTLVNTLYKAGFEDLLHVNYGLSAGITDVASSMAFVKALSGYLSVDNSGLTCSRKPGYKTDTENSYFTTANDLSNALYNGRNYVSITGGKSNNASKFYSLYINLENATPEYKINGDDINEAPATDSDKHNRYIFKVTRHTSNVFKCEQPGWFTCYGWLSEKETYTTKSIGNSGQGRQDNCKRWVALEGNFGDATTDPGSPVPNWKILQVQPVLPGNLCNYVSFSIPVRQGLELRITTGFDVGKNSGQYSNIPGSLANHIPNAFIGGIYV